MTHEPLTETRDLWAARPLWADAARATVAARRELPALDYDVIVVGAGISGALMAERLADGRRSVLIVDRRMPVRGSTLASTAMVLHEIDVPLHRLAREIGSDRASRSWLRSARSVEALVRLAREERIRCGLAEKRSLYLAGDRYGARAMKSEARARRRIGLDAEFLTGAELAARFGIERTGAIVSAPAATIDPARFTAGLLALAKRRGAHLVAGQEITDVRSAKGEVFAATAQGKILRARHVVFCTGYEFLAGVEQERHSVVSTWALATRPARKLPSWLDDHLVWEGSDPYLYFRSTPDGRVIAGGEDEPGPEAFQAPARLPKKARRITAEVSRLLGVELGAPEYRWAAAFGRTRSGLPLIGEVPGLPRVYAVMGFGGNGITFSRIAAEIVGSAIEGRVDPDADCFALEG